MIASVIVFSTIISASAATISAGDVTTSGSSVTVPISISGSPNIGSMYLDFTYDSTILAATGISLGTITSGALLVGDVLSDPVPNGAIATNISNSGHVIISLIHADGFSGDGSIAIVTFTKIASGTSQLDLIDVQATDPAYQLISFNVINGSYVSEVTLAGDLDNNGIVDMGELFAAIESFATGGMSMSDIFAAIAAFSATA